MPLDAMKDEPTPYCNVVRCTSCELGSLATIPEAHEVPAFYDLKSYYTHGRSHMVDRPGSFAEKVLVRLAYAFDNPRLFVPEQIAKLLPANGSICDLGCGDAVYLNRFAELGFEVVGVDPDENALKNSDVKVIQGTAEELPEPLIGQRYDLVIMTHSLEHCRNPSHAVRNAFEMTKAGGLCYIEVPNCSSQHFCWFNICSAMFDNPRHIHFFTPSALRALVRRAGFSETRSYHNGYVRNFLPSWRDWEVSIADRLRDAALVKSPPRHSFAKSVLLLLLSCWRRREYKYDSIGLLLARP
jgi:2-polyprenyl-3-methyl-5-hydroxy-6-metoxy-1,4-benzoquinol methylase